MGESLCSIQPTSMSPFTHLCVVLLAGVAMATTSTEWAKYKLQHSKVYSNEEDARRMYIWKKNVNMVEKHNSEDHSYTMAVNKFSDWTVEEFNNFLGYQPIAEKYNVKTFENVATPDSVDYRNENRVTPVKDQGQCCSCWAFSATGGIEGVWSKTMGELVSVSEQQMVDCVSGNDCNGLCKYGQLNHAILAVGYDKSGSDPYWIVKNSWGTGWGENGYIKMRMGHNVCGLKNDVSYPTM